MKMDLMLHEKRLLATFIDAGLVGVISLLTSIYIGPYFNLPFFSYDYFFLISFTLIMTAYQMLTLLIFKNKTLGMYLMGVRVLSEDWKNMNIKQIVLRSMSISIPILFVVNMAYVFINKNSKTIFDIISNSMVVNTGINYRANRKGK